MRQFLAELKRRNVYKVAVAYAAVAFVVVQAARLLVPALLLPEAVYRAVVVLALLGFPLALVVAWAFEVTPEGVKRTDAGGTSPVSEGAGRSRALAATVGLAVVGGAVLGAFVFFRGGESTRSSEGAISSVAVLPFDDMSPEGDQQYLGDGLAEQLLDALAHVEGLRVKARTSSFQFRNASQGAGAIGEALGVDALVEGSVQKSGDRVRVTAQLIDARTENHLWSRSYERRFSDIFQLQEEIARSVVEELQVELGVGEGRALVPRGTDDMTAYQIYLKGREALRVDEAREAQTTFLVATEFDTTYAEAWAAAAEAALKRALRDAPTTPQVLREAVDIAGENVERALALDSSLSAARAARAEVLDFQHRWSEAEAEWTRALELNPGDASARGGWAWHLAARGQWDRALEQARIEQELDPLHAAAVYRYADMLTYNGRYREAEAQYRRVLELESRFYRVKARGQLSMLYSRWGRHDEALAEARRAVERWATEDASQWMRLWTRLRLAAVHAMADRPEAARRGFAVLKDTAPRHAYEHLVGAVHAALGEADSAFHWLERSTPELWPPRRIVEVRGQPWWDPVRGDPRYAALLRRMGVGG